MAKVLVIGCNTGVLASRVAWRLANDGHQVLFTDSRLDSPHPLIEQRTIKAMDGAAFATSVMETDSVISCVENNPDLILTSATVLFNAMKSTPDKRVVLFSSVVVYGDVSGVVTEQAPIVHGDAYANARIEAELFAKAHNNAVCLRCGVEYGAGSERWSGMIGRLLLAKRLGDMGALGDGYCNLIHMSDVVSALVGALSLSETGSRIFNLCNRECITWNEYLIRFAVALEATPVRRIGPRRIKIEKLFGLPLKVLEKAMGPSAMRTLHLPVPITSSVLHAFSQRMKLDSTLAEQQLGMQWTSIGEGLKSAAEWVRSL